MNALTYEETFEYWKILFDYYCWIRDGGEALYGDITTAEAWCTSLMSAMTTLS